MDIQDPNRIALAANVELLLDDLDLEIETFRQLGEFPPEVRAELERAFLPERISDTLNIEGVHVNPRITRAILEGLTLAEADRYSEQEVLNVIAANELIESDARARMPLTLKLIREIHRRVEDQLIPTAGSLRDQNVSITGAAEQPPDWTDLRELLSQLCDQYERASEVRSVVRAAWLHGTFTAIHPFMDGNGRTGRLLQDFSLLSAGLLPVGIPISRRGEYYDSLEAADGADWRPLIEIIADSELTAIDRARRIAEAPVRRRARVQRLLQAAQTTVRQRDYNRYEVWRRRIEGIRDEFRRWAEDMNAAGGDLRIRIRTYDPISFEKWTELRTQGRARGTWLLSLTFSIARRPVYTFLLYARRHEFGYVLDTDEIERGTVSIFVTGADEPDARYEFGRYADPYVALRELLIMADGQLRVYRDPTVRQGTELPEGIESNVGLERWTCDDASLPDTVEEFFTDSLCKLGLIT